MDDNEGAWTPAPDPRPACAYAEDALRFVLGELSVEASREFREHLLQGCGTCGHEVENTRVDVASLDLALAERAQHGMGREDFESTRASIGFRLRTRIAAGANGIGGRGAGEADEAESDPPIPCPPLEPAPAPGIEVATYGEELWAETPFAGIRMRVLSVDRAARRWTCLIRMEAGASYPSHRHAGEEECLVLSGELDIGGRVLRRGDYQIAHEDSIHPVHTTPSGCEILLTSSWENELIKGTTK